MPMSREIRIATSQECPALWQAEYVKARLEQAHPGLRHPGADGQSRRQAARRPLAKIGGKGLFVKELETACWRTKPTSPCIR